uniref:Gustatory receptor n=1 Tax=Anopheles farauti TaxID=69004 RepID=A0A182Q6H0_9DIPT
MNTVIEGKQSAQPDIHQENLSCQQLCRTLRFTARSVAPLALRDRYETTAIVVQLRFVVNYLIKGDHDRAVTDGALDKDETANKSSIPDGKNGNRNAHQDAINRFVHSRAHYWTGVFLTITHAIISPFVYWCSISSVEHPKTSINYYMIVLQFLFMYTVVIISRIKASANRNDLCQLLNSLFAIREQALHDSGDTIFDHSLSRWLWMKLIVFDFGLMIVSAAFFRTFNYASVLYSLVGFLNLLLVSSMNVAVNFLMFVLYNAANIFRIINERCNVLVYGSNMSKETVRLYLMHTETTVVVKSIVEIFYTYTSLVQDLQSGSLDAMRNIVNPISFFFSEAAQLYFLVSASALFSDRARQIIAHLTPYTGRMTDGPGDQTVEILTIEYLNRDYSIGIKGLYTIDYTMLFSVYYIYVAALHAFEDGLTGKDYKQLLNPFIFFVYQCLQLYLLVLIPSLYTEQAIKMISLLNCVSGDTMNRPALDRLSLQDNMEATKIMLLAGGIQFAH